MNYYPFHIGDFRSGTVNMDRLSRWLYRDMIDVYYDKESPLPLDLDVLCNNLGAESNEERAAVERLLRFKFVKTEEGYRHTICDEVIVQYRTKAETARENGKAGGRPRKAAPVADAANEEPSGFPSGSDPLPIGSPVETGLKTNQEPRTNNQQPEEKKPRVRAAQPDGFALPDWVNQEHWDTWHASPKRRKATVGQKNLALKRLDAWRQAGQDHAGALENAAVGGWQGLFLPEPRRPNPADSKTSTVPGRKDIDPTLARINEDFKQAAPMPAHIRNQLNSLKRPAPPAP